MLYEMALVFLSECAGTTIALLLCLYSRLIGLLMIPWFHMHDTYLHRARERHEDLNVPEAFGLLRDQATPLCIRTADSSEMYTWHILSLSLYLMYERELQADPPGLAGNDDISWRLGDQRVRRCRDSRAVISFHEAGGAMASLYDISSLLPTYRIAGVVPPLQPLARFPGLLNFFRSMVLAKWANQETTKDHVRQAGTSNPGNHNYRLALIYALNDKDTPRRHTGGR